jgi:hypothetical protein
VERRIALRGGGPGGADRAVARDFEVRPGAGDGILDVCVARYRAPGVGGGEAAPAKI